MTTQQHLEKDIAKSIRKVRKMLLAKHRDPEYEGKAIPLKLDYDDLRAISDLLDVVKQFKSVLEQVEEMTAYRILKQNIDN